jgi:hypothetical protein
VTFPQTGKCGIALTRQCGILPNIGMWHPQTGECNISQTQECGIPPETRHIYIYTLYPLDNRMCNWFLPTQRVNTHFTGLFTLGFPQVDLNVIQYTSVNLMIEN